MVKYSIGCVLKKVAPGGEPMEAERALGTKRKMCEGRVGRGASPWREKRGVGEECGSTGSMSVLKRDRLCSLYMDTNNYQNCNVLFSK